MVLMCACMCLCHHAHVCVYTGMCAYRYASGNALCITRLHLHTLVYECVYTHSTQALVCFHHTCICVYMYICVHLCVCVQMCFCVWLGQVHLILLQVSYASVEIIVIP